jgi:protein-S-isoprenylcysteine O-methyltransferase Ste14
MWKWVAILLVVGVFANAFQKSGNPILEIIGDISVLLTILFAYKAWRKNKKIKRV